MQLFILDLNPEKAARMLCDIHLRKMCLENAQILSAVLLLHGKERLPGMPQPYNPRHPVIRALDNQEKINWVIIYNEALHEEYFRRFGKKHAYCGLVPLYRELLFENAVLLSEEKLSFARDFRRLTIDEADLVSAYRRYYRYKKTVLKNWHYTDASEPDWLT